MTRTDPLAVARALVAEQASRCMGYGGSGACAALAIFRTDRATGAAKYPACPKCVGAITPLYLAPLYPSGSAMQLALRALGLVGVVATGRARYAVRDTDADVSCLAPCVVTLPRLAVASNYPRSERPAHAHASIVRNESLGAVEVIARRAGGIRDACRHASVTRYALAPGAASTFVEWEGQWHTDDEARAPK